MDVPTLSTFLSSIRQAFQLLAGWSLFLFPSKGGVVSEDSILMWHKDQSERVDQNSKFLQKMQVIVDWIQNVAQGD